MAPQDLWDVRDELYEAEYAKEHHNEILEAAAKEAADAARLEQERREELNTLKRKSKDMKQQMHATESQLHAIQNQYKRVKLDYNDSLRDVDRKTKEVDLLSTSTTQKKEQVETVAGQEKNYDTSIDAKKKQYSDVVSAMQHEFTTWADAYFQTQSSCLFYPTPYTVS